MKKFDCKHRRTGLPKFTAVLLAVILLVNSGAYGVFAAVESPVMDKGQETVSQAAQPQGMTAYEGKTPGEEAGVDNSAADLDRVSSTEKPSGADNLSGTEVYPGQEEPSDTGVQSGQDNPSDTEVYPGQEDPTGADTPNPGEIPEETVTPTPGEGTDFTDGDGETSGETQGPEDEISAEEIPTEAVSDEIPLEGEEVISEGEEQVGAVSSLGQTSISALSNPKKGTLRVCYGAVAGAAGYQIQVSKTASFSKCEGYLKRRATVNIKPLVGKRTYYVRVRAFATGASGKTIYGPFSAAKSIYLGNGYQELKSTAKAVTIKSVKLISASTVRVKAKVSGVVKSKNAYYYLFGLGPNETALNVASKPLARINKKINIVFDVPLKYNKSSNRLQLKFAVGVKKNKASAPYKKVSTAKYISNPQKRAKYRQAFPKASTKKGLQVNENYISDAVKLGVKHTTYNLCLDDLFARPSSQNSFSGIPYQHNGVTYWFEKGIVQSYDRTLEAYKRNNMVVSAIILMRYRSDLTHLLYSPVSRSGFYALNTYTKQARDQLEAAFTFLAERYASTGEIANWIIGNEVNNFGVYHYTGSGDLNKNAKIYTDSFRLAYLSLKSVYSNARVYISLDHLWNTLTANGHGSRQFLNKFAAYWDSLGTFNIAYHAYPSPLTAPEFWTNSNGVLSNSEASACVNMGNIRVLTDYVKKHFGSSTRIILSEQGFTSKKGLLNVEKNQAAAIAYAYYIAEFNDMIDAFIVHRHIDHQEEIYQGLALGLWTNQPGTAEVMGSKKYAYKVFRYMDTPKCRKVTAFALPIIGKSSWKAAVPGFTKSRFR